MQLNDALLLCMWEEYEEKVGLCKYWGGEDHWE